MSANTRTWEWRASFMNDSPDDGIKPCNFQHFMGGSSATIMLDPRVSITHLGELRLQQRSIALPNPDLRPISFAPPSSDYRDVNIAKPLTGNGPPKLQRWGVTKKGAAHQPGNRGLHTLISSDLPELLTAQTDNILFWRHDPISPRTIGLHRGGCRSDAGLRGDTHISKSEPFPRQLLCLD